MHWIDKNNKIKPNWSRYFDVQTVDTLPRMFAVLTAVGVPVSNTVVGVVIGIVSTLVIIVVGLIVFFFVRYRWIISDMQFHSRSFLRFF